MEDNYTGLCVGGPLDGENLTSRFPKGALVVDRPTERAWIYEWTGASFAVRSPEAMKLIDDETADVNYWRAAEEFNYDVIALPEIDGIEETK